MERIAAFDYVAHFLICIYKAYNNIKNRFKLRTQYNLNTMQFCKYFRCTFKHAIDLLEKISQFDINFKVNVRAKYYNNLT